MSIWIQMDRRLADHWKVRRIATTLGLSRHHVVGCLAYLWGLAEDLGPDLGPEASDEDHGLPAGFLTAMQAVGWADSKGGNWQLRTRQIDRPSRSEIAKRAAAARWGANASDASDASGMHPNASDASMLERKRERKRKGMHASHAARRSSPPALNGADRPAAEVLINDPPGTEYLSPAEALRRIKEVQRANQLQAEGEARRAAGGPAAGEVGADDSEEVPAVRGS